MRRATSANFGLEQINHKQIYLSHHQEQQQQLKIHPTTVINEEESQSLFPLPRPTSLLSLMYIFGIKNAITPQQIKIVQR